MSSCDHQTVRKKSEDVVEHGKRSVNFFIAKANGEEFVLGDYSVLVQIHFLNEKRQLERRQLPKRGYTPLGAGKSNSNVTQSEIDSPAMTDEVSINSLVCQSVSYLVKIEPIDFLFVLISFDYNQWLHEWK